MAFKPEGIATGIGSFPHKDPKTACALIFETIPEMPIWPQLPGIDFREQMDIQYCEGLPRIIVNAFRERLHFDTSGDASNELAAFYENVMLDNFDYFSISPEYSRGIYEMEQALTKADASANKYFKSQVTGPVTLALGNVDENKRAIYYNEVFRDVIVKGMIMKARWLLGKFKPFAADQICFVDEPILSGFGSSTYVSVQRSDVVSCINEVVEAIHGDGALMGTHCCGNTEWTILIDAGVDIISFDAYEFGETIGYYAEKVNTFLKNGGVLAWGIVPTSEKITRETADSLAKKLEQVMQNLSAKGIDIDLIRTNCLLTPSCGTGSLSVEFSEMVFHKLSGVSKLIRGKN